MISPPGQDDFCIFTSPKRKRGIENTLLFPLPSLALRAGVKSQAMNNPG
jgi:hypothetical protein